MIPILFITLPLPPSKNDRMVPKTYTEYRTRNGRRTSKVVNRMVTSPAVYYYRQEVKNLIQKALEPQRAGFQNKKKTFLSCLWHKPSALNDVPNYHDELCDAVAPAIGVNDRYFLVRDLNYIVDKNNPRVELEIRQ